MGFKSLIEEVKGEFRSSSRKGSEGKLGDGTVSRSQSVHSRFQSVSEDEVNDHQQKRCWEDMPAELLMDVISRIDASDNTWPPRKHVVACAGVCRSWREITKEVVKTPEVSGNLTFPISLKQPGPRDQLVQCYIKRDRVTHTYHLYLGVTQALAENGKFLLASRRVRRPTHTNYIISLDPGDMSRGSANYIGKLRSHFLGTKFSVYDAQPPHPGAVLKKNHSTRLVGSKKVSPRVPPGNYRVAHISYELNVLGARGPRRILCVMDTIPATAVEPGGVAPTQTEFLVNSLDSFSSSSISCSKTSVSEGSSSGLLSNRNGGKDGRLILKNKSPRWHEQLQCWCLNFHGRVTVASVKNFQLVAAPEDMPGAHEHETVLLQFGKVAKDSFTMDYRYPLSAFQAFALCLSSFDTKIACE